MGLYKKYLSDRSYENGGNVRKAFKYEMRKVEAMDKIAEDPEDAATWHNNKILNWHVKKIEGRK